jgi:hypothetical protein
VIVLAALMAAAFNGPDSAPALDADGLPQGTDLKSVRTTVGQHGGSMTLHWENNWCTLRILFPLPKNE